MVRLNATAAQCYQLQIQHDEGLIIYENMGIMDKALNNQVTDSAKDIYLKYFKTSTPASSESRATIYLSICSTDTEKSLP